MKGHKCPHCGNRNPATIQDNGLRDNHPDLTLLCVAPVGARRSSLYDAPDWELDNNGAPAPCGMQWEPNGEDA